MPPQNWRTPKTIFNQLQREVPQYYPSLYPGGTTGDFTVFQYDLAAESGNNLAPFLPGDSIFGPYDSLTCEWHFKGVAWCNPPWNDVPSFIEKALESKVKVCFLLPAGRVDQKWFRRLAEHAVIEFFTGRVCYEDPLGAGRMQPREGSLVAWVGSGLAPGIQNDFRNNQTGRFG